MSATIVEIASAPIEQKSKRAQHLFREQWDANKALEGMLIEHGVLVRPVPHVSLTKQGAVEHAYARLWKAHRNEVSFWERQAKTAMRKLRAVLASDALTDEDRQSILEGIHGRAAKALDAKLLSDAEYRMVSQYRTMDDAGRQMIRTLCDRLAGTSAGTAPANQVKKDRA